MPPLNKKTKAKRPAQTTTKRPALLVSPSTHRRLARHCRATGRQLKWFTDHAINAAIDHAEATA